MADAPSNRSLPIVGLGAGTHAKSLLEAIRSKGEFHVVGLVDDDPTRAGTTLLDVSVSGPEGFETGRPDGVEHAFCGVGGVGSSAARRSAAARLLEAGFELPPIVHQSRGRLAPGRKSDEGATYSPAPW